MLIVLFTKRTTADANAWTEVEGLKGDRRISRELKGKVFSSCVSRVCTNALEPMALAEKQQEKVRVCENQPGKNNRES